MKVQLTISVEVLRPLSVKEQEALAAAVKDLLDEQSYGDGWAFETGVQGEVDESSVEVGIALPGDLEY